MTAKAARPSGWFPRRGEVCLIELDKKRPALILSSDALNKFSLDVCLLPISTVEHRQFSLRPKLRAGEGGLDHISWIKCDQPTTIEKSRVLYPPLGTLSTQKMEVVAEAVKTALLLR